MSRSLNAFIVPGITMGLWLASIVCAADKPQEKTKREESLRDYVQRNQSRQAFGVYLKGKKVGWVVEELKLGMHDGHEVAIYTGQSQLRFQFFGVESKMDNDWTTVYQLSGDGEILAANDRTVEDGSETEIIVTRNKKKFLITTKTGGQETKRRVAIPKETLAQMRQLDVWLESGRKKGDTFEDYEAAWDEADVDMKEVLTFQDQETILWGGVPTKVYRVALNIYGADITARIGSGGRMLDGKLGGLLDIRAEKEAVAKRLQETQVDMLAASAVRIDKPLGKAEQIRTLRLRISGLGDFAFPKSHRQRVNGAGNGEVILELAQDHRVDKPMPLDESEREAWLRSTPMIQSKHKSIRRAAKGIIGKEADTVKSAGSLAKWVFDNLLQTYAANSSSALQVLENRAGDCSEHALLFVALARSAGIPARIVGGLVYAGDDFSLFGWHAWAEIHDGSQWVSVDPIMDQVYVDATHIKFSESEDDWSWVNVAGQLKLELLDVKKDE